LKSFVDATAFIGKTVTVKMDRPLGSRHPRWSFIYPVNYGYVPGVVAPDQEELDAYVLGVFEPLEQFQGTCIAVVRRLDDDDDKLVVVAPGKDYTDDQIRALTEFQERFFTSVIVRRPDRFLKPVRSLAFQPGPQRTVWTLGCPSRPG
jgi:inorganic pyrophosphatase